MVLNRKDRSSNAENSSFLSFQPSAVKTAMVSKGLRMLLSSGAPIQAVLDSFYDVSRDRETA